MESLAALTERSRRLEQHSDCLKYLYILAKSRGQTDIVGLAMREFGKSMAEIVHKTAVAAVDTTSSGFVYDALSAELIAAADASSLMSLPWRRVNFFTRLVKETTAGTVAWVSEGGPIPLSRQSTDWTIIESTKVAGICVFTRELTELWSSRTAAEINRAFVGSFNRYIDRAFLDPAIAAVSQKSPASLTNGKVPVASLTSASESTFTAAVLALLQARVDGGCDLRNVVIAMSPTTALKASTLLTAGNIRAYPNLGARGGEIFGVPVVTTSGAASAGSPTENVVAAIDPTRVLMAADDAVQFAPSTTASLQMDDAPSGAAAHVSLFQSESTAFRFSRRLNFEAADSGSVGYFVTSF